MADPVAAEAYDAGPADAEPVTAEAIRPVDSPVFTQTWAQLTYLHWAYAPGVVAPLLPAGCRPDTVDGAAWVGLVPFSMRRVGILGTPPLPYLATFCETNVRTYAVGPDGRRSVVFLTLEASRLVPVLAARVSYRLPYAWARMRLVRDGQVVTYLTQRRWPGPRGTRSRVRVRVGAPVTATPLDDFLTARWGLHSRWYGATAYAPVAHERWPLRAAELLDLDDELVTTCGLPAPDSDPRVLYSEGVHVRIGRPRRSGSA